MQRFFSADSIEMTPDEKYIKVCVELEKMHFAALDGGPRF